MSNPSILFKKSDHAAWITLNRPAQGNAINLQMSQELEEACCQANTDDDIYVVVITGAGDNFCRGGNEQFSASSYVAAIEKPVIAAINGDVMGQGLELALACDIRIASKQSRFGFPEIAAGKMPSDGGTQRLPRIVGRSKALELVLTAQTINTDEALEIGLVSQVIDPEKLLSEADKLALAMSTKAPVALRYIKEAVNKGLDLTLEQGLRLEADLYFLLHTTNDRSEGIRSFLEKKPPQFKGK